MSIAEHVPWPFKMLLKMLLSRFPVSYPVWRRLGIFRLGAMCDREYAFHVFNEHFSRAIPTDSLERELVGLELGPGDSLFGALVAKTAGIGRTYFVDAGTFATRDVDSYYQMRDFLREKGLAVELPENIETFEALLENLNAQYLTQGLASLRSLPDAEVDFIWSHAVLQHVRRAEFEETVFHMYRVLRPGGVASHRVDLADMLGGALNNLRFSDATWESSMFASSGFYTNRIRYSEMLEIFRRAGFTADVVRMQHWDAVPTPPGKMAARFATLPAEDLRVRGFDVLLRRPG